jgi:hypothetical protein
MGIESQNSDSFRPPGSINDHLVAKVDAIEDSKCETEWAVNLREFFESMENLHAAMNGWCPPVSTTCL